MELPAEMLQARDTRRARPPPHTKPKPPPATAMLRRRPLTLSGPVRVRRGLLWRSSNAELRGPVLLLGADAHEVLRASFHARTVTVGVRDGRSLRLKLPTASDAKKWATALHAAATSPASAVDFKVSGALGRGGGGEVFLVRERATDILRAMKVVRKHDAFHSGFSLRHAMDERLVLELARGSPFIVRLAHAFQDAGALFHVIEFCAGGDLRTVLRRAPHGRLDEDAARKIFSQVILALEHVHSLNVIYRDLKPENVLLTNAGDVRLCDFGLAKVLTTGRFGRTGSFCGTTAYMSPEVVGRKNYGIATDLWSLGALFFRVLAGRAPFDDMRADVLHADNTPNEVHQRIQLDDVRLPGFLSKDAREMLEGLLRKREEDRWNLEELKESRFFAGVDWDDVLDKGRKAREMPEEKLSDEEALKNFDQERLKDLKVHGEADRKIEISDATPPGRPTPRRAVEGLSSRFLSLRKRPDPTEIVGFGYSFASDATVGGGARKGGNAV